MVLFILSIQLFNNNLTDFILKSGQSIKLDYNL